MKRKKTIDINGPVASKKINEYRLRAIGDLFINPGKARKGILKTTVSYPTKYVRPLQNFSQGLYLGYEEASRVRKIVFTLTARIE